MMTKGDFFNRCARKTTSSAYRRQASARAVNSARFCSKSANPRISQADAHELRLMIAPQPEALILVPVAMTQVAQGLLHGFAAAQPPAQDQFIHQIGRANRHFGQKFRSVEKQKEQLK